MITEYASRITDVTSEYKDDGYCPSEIEQKPALLHDLPAEYEITNETIRINQIQASTFRLGSCYSSARTISDLTFVRDFTYP